jgi:ketosteroid isomerase-like protein
MFMPPLPSPAASRGTPAAALMLPFACLGVADKGDAGMNESNVARLVERAATANDAFIGGDMRRWYALASPIGNDFTLMSPFGGAPSHGFDGSEANLDAMARRFTGGAATFELVESYATADMVVLAFIERQRARIDGLPEQDWSLRVTQVWARRGGQWQLVHRHADPLTHGRTLPQTAAIARGENGASAFEDGTP